MTKWQEITIDKPKEPYSQNLPYLQRYADYGFATTNVGMYSLPEENRDFRKHIENEIVMEELKTQNILGNHITGEADRTIQEVNDNTDERATEIKQKIQEHHNYIVNTVYPKAQEIDNEVETLTTKVDNSRGVIDQIWNKVKNWI
jgi:hypothetical protein